jgi:hypothetical protein
MAKRKEEDENPPAEALVKSMGLAEVVDDLPAVAVPVVSVGREQGRARVQELAEQIANVTGGVVDAMMAFADVPPDAEVPPEEWVTKYGQAGAERRLRIAKYGCLPSSSAPVALKAATTVAVGAMRSILREGEPPETTVNIQFNVVRQKPKRYPIIEVPE